MINKDEIILHSPVVNDSVKLEKAMEIIEKQRLELINYREMETDFTNQLTQANKTIMDLVQANFDIKEEMQTLRNENISVISELETQNDQIQQMTPVADVGGKVLNLFAELTQVMDMQKYQQIQHQQEQMMNGGESIE